MKTEKSAQKIIENCDKEETKSASEILVENFLEIKEDYGKLFGNTLFGLSVPEPIPNLMEIDLTGNNPQLWDEGLVVGFYMKDWIKKMGIWFLVISVLIFLTGDFDMNNWYGKTGFYLTIFLLVIGLIIEFFSWKEKKSKVSQS